MCTAPFKLSYSPCRNGGVERLGKDLLRVFKVVVSELGIDHGKWLDRILSVQSAFNHFSSP